MDHRHYCTKRGRPSVAFAPPEEIQLDEYLITTGQTFEQVATLTGVSAARVVQRWVNGKTPRPMRVLLAVLLRHEPTPLR